MTLPWHSARSAFRHRKWPLHRVGIPVPAQDIEACSPRCTDRLAISLGHLQMHERMIGIDPVDDHN